MASMNQTRQCCIRSIDRLTASKLVRSITTVVLSVTFVVLRNTFCVLTGKLLFGASAVVILAEFSLVTSVAAIVVVVTFPV